MNEKKGIQNTQTKQNPPDGVVSMGKEVMNIAETFGIEKKEIGKLILKSAISGKLDVGSLFSPETKTVKQKKFEVLTDNIIKLSWTFFSIFMIFQIFTFITGRLI